MTITTSFLADIAVAASKLANEAEDSARAAYGAYAHTHQLMSDTHDALLAATSAAVEAQVASSSAQESAIAQIAQESGYFYPSAIMEAPGQRCVDEVSVALFEVSRKMLELDDEKKDEKKGKNVDEVNSHKIDEKNHKNLMRIH